MQIILKTLWALSLVVFSATYVFGQDYVIEQDSFSPNHSKSIYFDMVDATDGYTSETGLTPTCTILYPSKTSYVSCPDTVTEIGTGTYRVRLNNGIEWENLGMGSLYITGTGSRPARIKYKVLEDSSRFTQGASLIKAPSDLNNTQQWSLNGVTATSNTTADYLGYTIADTITGDGASSSHRSHVTSLIAPGGSREYYGTVEVKSGTLNNIWVGDENWGVGIDLNTSSGAFSVSTVAYIKGWKIEKLASSWWRIHWRYFTSVQDSSAIRLSVALGNGTVGTAPPVFTTSGTMIVARAYLMPASAVDPILLDELLPDLQSASSASSVTLAPAESTSTDLLKNREICFQFGYTASVYQKVQKYCSCITAYDGTTKVATLSPQLATTLNNTYKYKVGGVCLNNVTASVSSIGTDVITASSIASGAIGASEIADNAIDAGAIASDAITSAKIAADAIGASEIAADAIGSSEIAADAIGSSEIAADAITDVKMSTAARNAIADTTWRRSTTNIEGSSYGDTVGYKSGYGMIAQQTHKSNANLGVQTTYKADGTTVLNSRSYDSNPNAEPITGLD